MKNSFLFEKKITNSGKVLIKICKIPVWNKWIKINYTFPENATSTEYTNKNFKLKKMHRTAVFASFSSNGKIADYVVYYLKGLKKVCDAIIFIADNSIFPEEMEKIKDLVVYAKFNRHEEYDFGSYKRGYKYAKQTGILDNCDELVLCNDSCYGPVYPFENVFEKMNKKKCDFWGLTANDEKNYHLQSYFLVFKKEVFKSKVFDKFMLSIKKEKGVSAVVNKYEIRFTKYLENKGFKNESFISYNPSNEYPYIISHNLTNFPRFLIKRNFPLVKVKIFKGGLGREDIDDVYDILKQTNEDLYKIVLKSVK